jgi:hypothetical protein
MEPNEFQISGRVRMSDGDLEPDYGSEDQLQEKQMGNEEAERLESQDMH